MFFLIRTEGGHGGGLFAHFAGVAGVLHIQYNPGAKRADGIDEATDRIGDRFGSTRTIQHNGLVASTGLSALHGTYNLHLRYVQVRRKKKSMDEMLMRYVM
jgi:hypothetical protein